MRAAQLLAPAAAVLIAAACSGENPGSPADGASDWTVVDLVDDPVEDHVEEPADVWPDAPVTVSDLIITENPRNTLSFYVSWSTSSEVLTELLVDCGDEYTRTFRGERATLTHDVFVMGLIAGLSCTVTAHPDRAGLVGEVTATCEDVGPLPPGLPVLSVDVVDAPRMQAGWTMLSVATAFEATWMPKGFS